MEVRAPILAAGGIVLQEGSRPRIAIVRLRKQKIWVLPKGKLYPGERALAAAKREVLEETGHSRTGPPFARMCQNCTILILPSTG